MTDPTTQADPAPFTADDFAARLQRAARVAGAAGLTGLLVTPGPDLLYLTGYAPVAITERITMLVVPVDGEPTMIVPRLERPDAEEAPGASVFRLADWTDGSDPYEATARLLGPGRYAVSDSAWAMHLLGLQDRLPETSYVSMTTALPMLRAIKDDDELERLAAAGAAADAGVRGDRQGAVRRAAARPTSAPIWPPSFADSGTRRSTSPSSVRVPNGANPHHEMGDRGHRARRHGGARLRRPQARLRIGHDPHGARRRAHRRGARGARDRARRAAGRVRGGPAGRRVPGDRSRRAGRDHRGRLRRVLHPPRRPRHRAHHSRTAVHGRGRTPAHAARHVLLDRTGHLPAGRFGVRIEDIVTVTADGGRRLNQTPTRWRSSNSCNGRGREPCAERRRITACPV